MLQQSRTIIFVGGPGSGKGTQAAMIARRFGLEPLIMSDLLKEKARTCLTTAAILSGSGLVSDAVVNSALYDAITPKHRDEGFVLDGHPRTVAQVKALDDWEMKRIIPRLAIFYLDVPRQVLADRLLGRRCCPKCGQLYNLLTKPPRKSGVCDVDGQQLVQRNDDKPSVIAGRLQTFQRETVPAIDQYRRGPYDFYRIIGVADPEWIAGQIAGVVAGF